MAYRSQIAGRARHPDVPLSRVGLEIVHLFLFLFIGTVNVRPLKGGAALINGRELTLMVNAFTL